MMRAHVWGNYYTTTGQMVLEQTSGPSPPVNVLIILFVLRDFRKLYKLHDNGKSWMCLSSAEQLPGSARTPAPT